MIESLDLLPQKTRRLQIERSRKPLDVIDADVALASLYGADIGPVQAREIGELLL